MKVSIALIACLLLSASHPVVPNAVARGRWRTFASLPSRMGVETPSGIINPGTGPNDPEFSKQGYYNTIGVLAMWARGITGLNAARPVTIAIVDTGVSLGHQDLIGNLVTGYDFTSNLPNPVFPTDTSRDSHGTMVAGVIAAKINNAVGIAGIGGGDTLSGTSGLRIMPLKVAKDSEFRVDCAVSVQAIDYARTHGANIINISYAGYDFCQAEFEAIQRAYNAGLAIVAGAGNDDTSIPVYPAAYGTSQNKNLVIAVTGLYSTGVKADDANYGNWVDLAAPFWGIRSTTRTGYGTASGTSYSVAFVSGLIGLLMSNYGFSRDVAVAAILSTADSVNGQNPGYSGLLGVGRINADKATRP